MIAAAKKLVPLPIKEKTRSILNDIEHRLWVYSYRPKLVELDKFRLYVLPDYIGQNIVTARSYEAHVTRVLEKLLKPGCTFLDLGANMGYFTMLAARRGCKVIAFEPNPKNVELINMSLKENGLSNATVHELAASDREAEVKFITVGSNGGIVTPAYPPDRYHFFVRTARVDLIVRERVDVVKMDIESHEPFALKGMGGLIKKYRPLIVTEYHPWALRGNNRMEPEDYLRQLMGHGYRLAIIETSGNILDAPDESFITRYWRSLNDDRVQLDLVCRDSDSFIVGRE